MDLISHALYGATMCSRTGFAGGRRGAAGTRWYRDVSVWWSLLFGLAPDILSMWIPFLIHQVAGPPGNFFRHFDGPWLTVYRIAHSLVSALAVSAILYAGRRALFVPSLAWTVHILMDAGSHVDGKFQTLPFYPFSSWGINGIAWWRSSWLIVASWSLLPVIWIALAAWRRNRNESSP